jgi:hypothetical protein
MAEHKPMTYREIKGYIEKHHITVDGNQIGWDDDTPDEMPRQVFRWLNHEVVPAILKTGRYEFPSDLDLICPHTYELKTGRYATEPIE